MKSVWPPTVFQKRRSDRKNFEVSAQRKSQRNHFTFWLKSGLRPNFGSVKGLAKGHGAKKSKSEVTHWSHWWRWGGIRNVIEYRLKKLNTASKPLKTMGNCISTNPKFNFFLREERIPRQTRACARQRPPVSPFFRVPRIFKHLTPSRMKLRSLCRMDGTEVLRGLERFRPRKSALANCSDPLSCLFVRVCYRDVIIIPPEMHASFYLSVVVLSTVFFVFVLFLFVSMCIEYVSDTRRHRAMELQRRQQLLSCWVSSSSAHLHSLLPSYIRVHPSIIWTTHFIYRFEHQTYRIEVKRITLTGMYYRSLNQSLLHYL